MTNVERNQKRAQFLLKVFIVRHIVGIGLFIFLTISAIRLQLTPLALGSGALTLLYTGVAVWMGFRLHKAGHRS